MVDPLLLRVPGGAAGPDGTRRPPATTDGRGRCEDHGAVLPDGRGRVLHALAVSSGRNRLRPGATSSANRQIVVDRATDHGSFANLARYATLLVGIGATLPVAAARRHRRRELLWRPTGGARCCCSRFLCRSCCSSATPCPRAVISIPVAPDCRPLTAAGRPQAPVASAAGLQRRQGLSAGRLDAAGGHAALIESVRVVTFCSAQDDTRTVAARLIRRSVPAAGHHPDRALLGPTHSVARESRGIAACKTGVA